MRKKPVKLMIIGAGPAGLAAAVAAADAGVDDILLLDRMEEMGGILQQCIHNGFGLRYFEEELTGTEYAQRFIDQVLGRPKISVKTNTMVVEVREDLRVTTINPQDGMVIYQAEAIILAMGCRERPRGAINIAGSRGAGIYTAGTVQRLMNIEGYLPGRQAVILGSGDIGLIMARRLTLEGVKVHAVLELQPYSSGLGRNIVQCLEDYNIPLYLSHTIVEISGEKRVEAVKVAPVDWSFSPILEKAFTISCDTLILSVGLIPENELSSMAGVEICPATAGPLVDTDYHTTVPGIFACGNVVHVHDLVDDVSEEGAIAGRAAADYLRGRNVSTDWLGLKPAKNIRSVVPQKIFPDRNTLLYIRPLSPAQNVLLRVGDGLLKQKAVTPGETLRYLLKPEDIPEDVRTGINELSIRLEEDE
jgi:NADPH-dependent 2,4-dienoyl-CoA reductase/sulfur reductase-like enzyme